MKLQTLSTGIGLIATGAIALASTPAQAFNFTTGSSLGACGVLVDNMVVPDFTAQLDDTVGVTSCKTADGFTLSTQDGYLQGKQVDDPSDPRGVGISGSRNDLVKGEINKGELLSAILDKASKIASIDLSFLYLPPVYGDIVHEIAVITAGGTEGQLKVTSQNSATWSLGGLVTNLDLSKKGEGGAYSIANPFGDTLISALQFTVPPVGNSFKYSDYSLVAIEKASVPEPATLLGLAAVGGLMAASRRNKKSA